MNNYIHTKLAFATKCYNVSENVQFSARSQHSGVGQSAKGVQQVGAECGGAISKPVQLLPKVPDCRSCRCIVPQRGIRVPAATVPFRLHAKIYSIISGCIRFVCCINFFLLCWKKGALEENSTFLKVAMLSSTHQPGTYKLGEGCSKSAEEWYIQQGGVIVKHHLHFHLSEELKKGNDFSSICYNRKISWNNPLEYVK